MTVAGTGRRLDRLARVRGAVDQLVAEVLGRSADADVIRPTRRGSWWYAARIPAGGERAIHARSPLGDTRRPLDAEEFWAGPVEIILDEAELGESHLGRLALGGDTVAYTVDPTGAESFGLVVDGQWIAGGMAADVEVSADGRTIYAVALEEGRPARAVSFRRAGATTLFEEPTPERWIELDRVGDRLIVTSRSLAEDRVTAVDDDVLVPCSVRGPHVRAVDDSFVIVDGRVHHWAGRRVDLRLPAGSVVQGAVVIRDVMLLHLRVHAEHALGWVLTDELEGQGGAVRLLWSSSSGQTVSVDGSHGDTVFGVVESLVQQPAPWFFDARRRRLHIDPGLEADAHQRRTWVTAGDGERIPVTLAHVEARTRSGPLVLLVYGAYGVPFDARFSPGTRSLIERGVTLAIAHVRGGGELGPGWHAAAVGRRKPTSVDDYLAVAHHLIDHGWTDRGLIVAQGSSAGGTVVAAALNREPDLFAGCLVHAPFVDPLSGLSDGSARAIADIAEWGDPADPIARGALATLTAADTIRVASDYPPVLAFAGRNDPRAPAEHVRRWIDALRAHGADAHVLVDDAGHDGAASRRRQRESFALELAWTLDILGVALAGAPR